MISTDSFPQFATVLEVMDDGHMLHVFGEVALSEASKFAAAMDQAAADGETVSVNLTKCRYIDSSGLTELVRANERFRTQLRLLIGAKSQIRRIFELTKLDSLIPTSYIEQIKDEGISMEQLLCGCGHSVPQHDRVCRSTDCDCRRDRFGALERALDLAARQSNTGANRVRRLNSVSERNSY